MITLQIFKTRAPPYLDAQYNYMLYKNNSHEKHRGNLENKCIMFSSNG